MFNFNNMVDMKRSRINEIYLTKGGVLVSLQKRAGHAWLVKEEEGRRAWRVTSDGTSLSGDSLDSIDSRVVYVEHRVTLRLVGGKSYTGWVSLYIPYLDMRRRENWRKAEEWVMTHHGSDHDWILGRLTEITQGDPALSFGVRINISQPVMAGIKIWC